MSIFDEQLKDEPFDLGYESELKIGKWKGCTVREVVEDMGDPGILIYYRDKGILTFTTEVNEELDAWALASNKQDRLRNAMFDGMASESDIF